jgi:hypothetical protein
MAKKTIIAGNSFLFTGKLTEFTREEAETHVEAEGGKVLSGVSAKLNYLVVGEDAGSKLAKAEALGTVTILHEKEFLKMMPKKNASSDKTTVSSNNSETMPQDKNEIILSLKLPELKKIFKKYASSSITDKILTSSESIQTFGDISSSDESYFYFVESEGKLIMNYLIQDNYDEFRLDEDFFKELSKHTNADFKIAYVNRNIWSLSFCLFSKGEIQFSEDSVNEWEDPMYFDDYPYFVKLAKSKGMKKKKDEFDDKVWDSQEVYDLIYEFRDNIASGYEYVNLAPEWYIDYKSIPN